MPEIVIRIKDKRPRIVGDIQAIVADNSDYTIRFEFDKEWQEGGKTVWFVRSSGYAFAPVQTVDDTVRVPVQRDVGVIAALYVGVQQGDVETSRACEIKLLPAITDHIDDSAVQPEESMWQAFGKRLDSLESRETDSLGGTFAMLVDFDAVHPLICGENVILTDENGILIQG